MEACPTGALEMPYQLNIRRCIAYLTLESSDNIPDELRGKLKNRVYGCDICQDACPYNRFARPHNIPEFLPHESLMTMRKNDWINLTESEFDRIFTGTPVKRAGHQRLMRNIEFLL